jgi:cyclopropane fatty-acyl-phospholipid synthase-like methyltransferase
MPTVAMPYIDDSVGGHLDKVAAGEQPGHWRTLHWGLYADPQAADDDPERFVEAAEAMTEAIVTAGEVGDDRRVVDVGCGFGGTIDHVAARNRGCSFVGINIDERQLRRARALFAAEARAADPATPFVTADGCRLPLADASVDHVLAIECVFHFPSRKTFFKEAARVLRPGGTLALSDFVLAAGAFADVIANAQRFAVGGFFGDNKMPLTSAGCARAGRAAGLDVLVDDDVTTATLPTYGALARSYDEMGQADAVQTILSCEQLARAGGWEYHVISFRKRDTATAV